MSLRKILESLLLHFYSDVIDKILCFCFHHTFHLEKIFTMTDTEKIQVVTDGLSCLSVSKNIEIQHRPVYVPLNSLTESMINSIVSTVLYSTKKDWHHSKRTLLAFLLAIHDRVSQDQTDPIRQLLVDRSSPDDVKQLDWNALQEQYEQMMKENEDGTSAVFEVEYEPYYELKIENVCCSFRN